MSHETAALAFILILAGLILLGVIVRIVRSNFTLSQCFLFAICVLLTRVLWRASVPKRLPLDGRQGAVIVSNHRSSADPFFIQVCTGRLVHWLVIRESFSQPIAGWTLRAVRAIPVRRSGIDTAATKTAIRYAAEGGLVGMFPEGRINTSDQFMRSVRPGAALIALAAQVPILPCYIEGAPYAGTDFSPFFMPARVKVTFGDPIDLSAYWGKGRDADTLKTVMRLCVKQIANLAQLPDFEPQFAGRQWASEND